MKSPPLQRDAILPRIDGIQKELMALRKLSQKTSRNFSDIDFNLSSYHLQHVLEGIFNIGAHILSRVPGTIGKSTRYQDIARSLGVIGVIPKAFAENTLVKMAGYRNRLVHDYAEITKAELRNILITRLDDCDFFIERIERLLKNPGKFGFTIA